jgi:hypothetical protein
MFADEFGLPLTMKPNFEDLSCQVGEQCRYEWLMLCILTATMRLVSCS